MHNYRVQLPNGKEYDIIVRRAWMAGHGELPRWEWAIRYCNEYLPSMESGYGLNEIIASKRAREALVKMAQKMTTNKGDRVIIDYMSTYETLPNTKYGNPRYALHLDYAGRVITSSDISDAYAVTNSVGKISLYTLTRAGRIRHINTVNIITDNDKD